MSKRHDDVFDQVLGGLDATPRSEAKAQSRFLRRSNTMAEQATGERQEKVLRLVDPTECKMWDRHNRAYDLLTAENCQDLIDGIRSQGQQEFPAIVRQLPQGQGARYEVICGARRHFAISWLRANNYPQFKYLIEVRDLTDEEAFRLADIENRDRQDISDFERARDYAQAIELYYGGTQKQMAERLEVSQTWLSRYLDLARLPDEVIAAFPSIREIKEIHARQIKPLLKQGYASIISEAKAIAVENAAGKAQDVAAVLRRFKAAVAPPKRRKQAVIKTFKTPSGGVGAKLKKAGNKVTLELPAQLTQEEVKDVLEQVARDWH